MLLLKWTKGSNRVTRNVFEHILIFSVKYLAMVQRSEPGTAGLEEQTLTLCCPRKGSITWCRTTMGQQFYEMKDIDLLAFGPQGTFQKLADLE